MRLLLLFLFFSSATVVASTNPFIGIWKYDKERTLDVGFKGHDVSKIKNQHEYVQHSEAGSLLFFSVVELTDGRQETYHVWIYPDGRVSGEFARSKKGAPIDRIQSKKLDDHTYGLYGVKVDPENENANDWRGTAQVSKDNKYLTFKIKALPGEKYEFYYKVFRRVE